MGYSSLDLRRRLVEAYESGLCLSYEHAAELFGVGRATVSRTLRRKRETGDVRYKPGGHRERVLDRQWLAEHAEKYPDARRQDRADAWENKSGIRVCAQTISKVLREIGWTYKKRHQWRVSGIQKGTN